MKLLSDLLRSVVVDSDGRQMGNVKDVRVIQDGPPAAGSFDAALRVDGVVVGAGSLGVRLGYHRHAMNGPALLKLVFGTLERRAVFVPWDEVDHWDGATLTLKCTVGALVALGPASGQA